jgi:hypothetical protein
MTIGTEEYRNSYGGAEVSAGGWSETSIDSFSWSGPPSGGIYYIEYIGIRTHVKSTSDGNNKVDINIDISDSTSNVKYYKPNSFSTPIEIQMSYGWTEDVLKPDRYIHPSDEINISLTLDNDDNGTIYCDDYDFIVQMRQLE